MLIKYIKSKLKTSYLSFQNHGTVSVTKTYRFRLKVLWNPYYAPGIEPIFDHYRFSNYQDIFCGRFLKRVFPEPEKIERRSDIHMQEIVKQLNFFLKKYRSKKKLFEVRYPEEIVACTYQCNEKVICLSFKRIFDHMLPF